MPEHQPVIIVAGPTASGKSALALDIAEEFNGVVINADSMQVYRELNILSARPSPEDEARAPHRLYGVLPAAEPSSAMRWRETALREIRDAHERGRLPVLCGGTGLYLRALTQGLSPIPDAPEDIRNDLGARLAAEGTATLYDELLDRDPEMAARLEPGDSQRILRALEILEATGLSLAEWLQEETDGPPAHLRFTTILMAPPREALYAACDARFSTMLENGALDEVRRLTALQLDPGLPAMKALGVRELADHLAGKCRLDEAAAAARQSTRRYAKRQTTWFRHQIIADLALEEQYSESLSSKIFAFIRQNVLTGAK